VKNRLCLVGIASLLTAAGTCFGQDVKPMDAGNQPADKGGMMKQPFPQPTARVYGENDPKLTFESETKAFGNITDEKEVSHEFKFTNTGKGTLNITNTQGSCGCTVPALAKREYAPGESGVITVKYNPHNRRGKQHTTVTVTSNDPVRAAVVLNVESHIIPQVQIDPPIVNFGTVNKGGTATQKVTLSSRLPDLKVTSVTSNNPKVIVKLEESAKAQLDGSEVTQFPITITVDPSIEVGQLQSQITILTSDGTKSHSVQAMGEVVGDIAAAPSRVQLNGVSPAQAITTQVRLSARNGKAFKILNVEEAPATGAKLFGTPSITTDESVTPAAYVVTFTGTCPNTTGGLRGDFIVTTDLPDEKTMRVPYFGFIKAPQAKPGATAIKQNPTGGPGGGGVWETQPSMLVPR